ncbi:Protein WAX2 [Morus notabilis]|uniref:Protein WAX2 n=1 Tax=Morus notabilis TaxID=981085 RepID=W9RFV9_9ROSA|nr:Protein WAX2 [Morus notabilis]
MATTPGILTDWPWKRLGSFKRFTTKFGLVSLVTEQPKAIIESSTRVLNSTKLTEREIGQDDQILLSGIIIYLTSQILPGGSNLPMWKTDGVILTILLHASVVEFLYYWLHRVLHHHFLYSRYHSHHHSSIVTEPITSVIHPFAEHVAYFILFAIPLLTTICTETASVASVVGYMTFIDFMNNLGHCNFEIIPKWFFSIFPPLKYLMYTPTFHSLHHTQFRTNYSLFMPLYDYIYSTMDKSYSCLYESLLKRRKELPDVVHLTHLITPGSIYHLRLGFAGLASKPYVSKWYLRLFLPVTFLGQMVLRWLYGHSFVVERLRFGKLKMQTWVVPKYKIEYLQWKNSSINDLIDEAILKAEEDGSMELNAYGELYINKHPQLNMKIVDGSSLATAVVLNNIPKGTTQVLFRGKLNKVAYAIAFALCQMGIQIATLHPDEHEELNKHLTDAKFACNSVLSRCCSHKS